MRYHAQLHKNCEKEIEAFQTKPFLYDSRIKQQFALVHFYQLKKSLEILTFPCSYKHKCNL